MNASNPFSNAWATVRATIANAAPLRLTLLVFVGASSSLLLAQPWTEEEFAKVRERDGKQLRAITRVMQAEREGIEPDPADLALLEGKTETDVPAVPPAPDYGVVSDTVRASSDGTDQDAAGAEPEAPKRFALTPSRSLDSVRIDDAAAIGTVRNRP